MRYEQRASSDLAATILEDIETKHCRFWEMIDDGLVRSEQDIHVDPNSDWRWAGVVTDGDVRFEVFHAGSGPVSGFLHTVAIRVSSDVDDAYRWCFMRTDSAYIRFMDEVCLNLA